MFRKPSTRIRIFGIVFLMIGLILLGSAAGVFVHNTQIHSTYEKTTGYVVESGDNFTVISYTVYEKEIEKKYSFSASSLQYGDPVTIYYDPAHPRTSHAGGSAESILYWILIPLGVAFAIPGFLITTSGKRKERKKQRLLETGTRILATITEIQYDTLVSFNGANPMYLLCEGTDINGEKKMYRSENLWDVADASLLLGRPVQVFVNPAKPSSYCVDTTTLLCEVQNRIM